MESYEIDQDKFENSVRILNVMPVEDIPRYSRVEIPISYTSFDSYEKFNKIEQPEWDIFKDCEAKELELKKLKPPPVPTYNQKNRSNVTPIEKIINEPGRNSRAEKIIIFIRGAPSSGKSFLAHKIMEQEKLFGTKRMKFCTPNKYYANQSFNRDEADKYVKNLHSEVQDLLMEGFYTFIIVEMEGFKLDILNKLGDLATASLFEVYGIDVNQTVEVCKQYQKHSRYNSDIEEIAKEVEKNSMPYNFKLLNPVELIDPGWNARNPPKPPKTPSPPSKSRKNRGGFGRRRKSSSDSYDSDACFVCYG